MINAEFLFSFYKKLVLENKQNYQTDYADMLTKMSKSTAKYKGTVIDFLYQPFWVTPEDDVRFKEAAAMMCAILEKVILEYKTNASFRQLFGFSNELESLVMVDPGYRSPFPMGRFDLFYSHDDNFKFCELNTDGSSAMNETNVLEEIFLSSAIAKQLGEDYELSFYELFESWTDELLRIYKEFGGTGIPNIAIVDFDELGTTEEFLVFQKTFEKRGIKTIIADPRTFKHVNGRLWADDFPIDLVYRRAVTRDVMAHFDLVQPFLEAYKAGDVCVVGPFTSQIVHNKIIFEILFDKSKTPFLNSTERDFIERHIPPTYLLSKSTMEDAIAQKDAFIVKPLDLYAAKGVYAGRDFEEQQWRRIVGDCVEQGDYLLQQYVVPKSREFIFFENDQPIAQLWKTITGLFVYNGKFSGLYTRTGKKNVIADLVGCRVVPNIKVSSLT